MSGVTDIEGALRSLDAADHCTDPGSARLATDPQLILATDISPAPLHQPRSAGPAGRQAKGWRRAPKGALAGLVLVAATAAVVMLPGHRPSRQAPTSTLTTIAHNASPTSSGPRGVHDPASMPPPGRARRGTASPVPAGTARGHLPRSLGHRMAIETMDVEQAGRNGRRRQERCGSDAALVRVAGNHQANPGEQAPDELALEAGTRLAS